MKALALAGVLLAGCVTGQPADVVSPRMLNENAVRYDGRHVVVRGMLLLGTNGRSLYQSKARFEQWEKALHGSADIDFAAYEDDCLTMVNVDDLLEEADRLHGNTVTVGGKFVATYYGPNSVDLQRCGTSALVVDPQSVKQVLRQ